ncbi:pentapeptide repeat-containing protein [Clostridium sp. FP1]|nr:pentapeptide repeat-containing protein [Clostridium sp. FP1]
MPQTRFHSDFQNSKFLKVEFQESNLLQSQMNFTNLKKIDFTSCNIESIGANIADFEGARVTTMQAISISAILGLIIE